MDIINEQIRGFLEEPDMIAALSNISALINMSYDNLNWAGFYFVRSGELVLGPFQGKPACTHIPFDRGVCGRTYRTKQTQLVDDVLQVPDHIACDSASRSELCVPVIVNGECIMEIDIDAPIPSRFDECMKKEMEQAAEDIASAYVSHLWKL
jgi:GAF domain-containing protein